MVDIPCLPLTVGRAADIDSPAQGGPLTICSISHRYTCHRAISNFCLRVGLRLEKGPSSVTPASCKEERLSDHTRSNPSPHLDIAFLIVSMSCVFEMP